MTCRREDGGAPKCPLGERCRNVELRGKSLESIYLSRAKRRPYACKEDLQREYDLFVVLESPSWYDDLSGGLGFDDKLDTILNFIKQAGFQRDRVFISTLLKCYSKKSSLQDIKACLPYLQKEIELTKPKVIMLLGAKSLRVFNLHNKGGMNAVRGRVFTITQDEKTYTVIPSYSPGYLEYAPDPALISKRIQEDYILAASLVSGVLPETKNINKEYEVLVTVEEIEKKLRTLKNTFFAFDTESRALPFTKEPLICLSISPDGEKCFIIPFYRHDPNGPDNWKLKKVWSDEDQTKIVAILKDLFEDSKTEKIAHNISYDMNVLRKHLGIKLRGFAYDSMLLHHILVEQKPHDLEYLADLEFGTGQYSSPLKDIVGKGKELIHTYDWIPDDLLYPYTAVDVKSCFKLGKVYLGQLAKKPHLWKLYCEETEPLIHALTDAVWHGHYVDQPVLKELIKDFTDERDKLLAELKTNTFPGFNPASPNHVKQVLLQLGFEEDIRDKSKITGFNTGKENLLKLQFKTPIAEAILKYRNLNKFLGTYLENLEGDIDSDGRVRYTWLIHGTETGRLSCRFYHQLPRPDKSRKVNLRDLLAAPVGKKLVYCDFSQLELRILAVVSGDKEMLRLFEEGKDLHTATAAVMLGIPEDKVSEYNRQLGKNTNFGLAYGSEGYRLIQTNDWMDDNGVKHPFTMDMFFEGMIRFRERFKELALHLESVPILTRNNGNIYVTQFGRERRIGAKIVDRDTNIRKAAEREVVNFTIQSPAGALMLRLIGIMHKYILEWRARGELREEDLFLVNTVHDSGTWEVIDKFAMPFARILKKVAERPIPELRGYCFPIDVGMGQNWTEAGRKENKIKNWN